MLTAALIKQLRAEVAGTIECGVPSADFTTWKVGGRADALIEPHTATAAERALEILHREKVPWLAIGGGSNLLIRDGGYRGVLISTRKLRTIDISADQYLRAESGASLAEVSKKSISAGLAGFERLAGIPGTIGGATVMNAGAKGTEVGSMVHEVILHNGVTRMIWNQAQCAFAYRQSAIPTDALVTQVKLKLAAGDAQQLRSTYDEQLKSRLAAHPYEWPNAGSVFKNPPRKAAWKLIDAAGLRGEQRGGAQISPRHANFIVNLGTATANDILALVSMAQERVADKFGIELELEVKVVGEAGNGA